MNAPQYLNLNAENLAEQHLCCALGDKKHIEGVEQKKAWLKERFKEGLVFRKLDVRGKVFIEYMPSEFAWRPIVAQGWFTIHCLWVSGKYAKQGHARALLDSCVADARKQKKAGIVVATAKTKRPFLSDPKFLAHYGFEVVDAVPGYKLWAYYLDKKAGKPTFATEMKEQCASGGGEFIARYTDQCPFNLHWAEQMAESFRKRGYEVSLQHIKERAQAQKVRSPLGTFGLERNGGLVTHFLHTDGAVERLLKKL